ncbi:cyclic AMP-dependent transcription factor ATF-7b isoform X4 [Anarrhichthys ocellatus]|uniref:cyclic AMP-dependent transcription factor ATF-7b isoform X4 n=1 Tax=Anarrhichthys ocellatus TaxID=433405 RepID=UPI0012EEA9DE|nr:cyclic AMP-dependent transcription factor ATF-7-like isoform X4 [Anarrhichthys ocellatus]
MLRPYSSSRGVANGSVSVNNGQPSVQQHYPEQGGGSPEAITSEHLSEMGDDRPFVCTAPGCGQRFTNEDHLSVHKHKHEMTLKFGPARTDSVIIADQTPTPTRFLKNCEEVGLFNELAGSFEHEFTKAHEDDQRTKHPAAPLQTPSEVKVEDEGPLQVDSSSPGSPDSSSSMSDNSRDSREIHTQPVVSSAPTPTIVRPGSLHLSNEALHPTLPSPTSVITQTPPSNRQLSSPTSAYPLVRLPNGQTVPLLPSPVQMTSVISVSHFQNMKKNFCYFSLNLPYSICFSLSRVFVVMWSLRGQRTRCPTSLGFQDLQWAEPAVGRPPRLGTVCTLRPRWAQEHKMEPVGGPDPSLLCPSDPNRANNPLKTLMHHHLRNPRCPPLSQQEAGGGELRRWTLTRGGSVSWRETGRPPLAAGKNESCGLTLWRRRRMILST